MTCILYVCQLRAKVEELQEELDECREDLKRDEEIFGAKVCIAYGILCLHLLMYVFIRVGV